MLAAVEAEDDRALLRLLDQRCSDMAVQRERDVVEITDLSGRVAELQSDLEACLATLQRDPAIVSSLLESHAPPASPPQVPYPSLAAAADVS